MENNMDGVKISVNKDGDDGASKRRGRPKKAIKSSAAEARPSSESRTSSQEKKSKGHKGGMMSTVVAIAVTALVVGGGIYAWQNKNSEKGINDVREDARKVRVDFEQRMEQLKNKLSGVETENQKLKDTTKELEEYATLLKGAKLEFTDTELGISFEYPAILGEVSIEKIKGTSGQKIKGVFSKNDKLVFGGVSNDYVAAASSTAVDFMETQGFMEKSGKYYFQKMGKTDSLDYEFTPSKLVSTSVLLLDKNSFAVNKDTGVASIDLGENIGALVNTGSDKIRGLAFVNQDLGLMPLENLETLLKGIETKK